MPQFATALSLVGLLAVGSLPANAAGAAPPCPAFRVGVEGAGIVRLTPADLPPGVYEGLRGAGLSLSTGGAVVPIHALDAAGFEFQTAAVPSTGRSESQVDSRRVFRLTCAGGAGGAGASPVLGAAAVAAPTVIRREEDRILARFTTVEDATEVWFWRKLASGEAVDFEVPKEFETPRAAASKMQVIQASGLTLRLHVRGWSRPARPGESASHRLEAAAADRRLASWEWSESGDETTGRTLSAVLDLPIGTSAITLRVPSANDDQGRLVPDVVLLDWLEFGGAKALGAPPALRPDFVEIDRPSAWRSPEHRADLLVVGPRDLLDEIGPLVARRRGQGLAVEVVDVVDVFDEWSHGQTDPRALRDFVAYAKAHWATPPRYLLLVGDASWDAKNPPGTANEAPDAAYSPMHGVQFAEVPSARVTADRRGGRARNLVPTWTYNTLDGHAAGDNFFVDADSDLVPELAVGRLPITAPEEARAIVAKLLAYEDAASQPTGKEWRHRVTLVTSEDVGWQLWGDELGRRAEAVGFTPRKVYSRQQGDEAARDDPAAVGAALAAGDFLFHFVGHGGRFIWRTGPPDWSEQRDLFNLDDVDRLTPTAHPPIVLAMTCYSAPFDHPEADSIGEKLLRTPGRGAIAVLAAGWRTSPTELLSQIVVGEFLAAQPGDRLGDVVLRAKKKSYNLDFLQQYNLLGDPSLPLSRP
jgi:hypothetical protein